MPHQSHRLSRSTALLMLGYNSFTETLESVKVALRPMADQKCIHFERNISIIALTASVVGDIRGKVSSAGMNGYVSKPFQPKELYPVMASNLKITEEIQG